MRLNSSKNYWIDVQNIRREEEVKYFLNLYEGQQSFGATRYDAIYINVHVHLFVKMMFMMERKKNKKTKTKTNVWYGSQLWSDHKLLELI